MAKFAVLLAGLFLSTSALAHEASIGPISIERPAVRAMVPGAKVGGGYLTIRNNGTQADKLVSASADRARSVQMHEMSTSNGIMVMREMKDGIDVPSGQTVDLQPGGSHLMFMDVQQPFKQGEEIKATLTFERAGSVDVMFDVGPIAGPLYVGRDGSDHTSMEMPGMDMDAKAAPDDPSQSIPATLKIMFDRPEKPLVVEPVVVQGDWAIAGWQQDGRGGRALLMKTAHGWRLHLCSGDGIKDAASLEKIGLSTGDASALSSSLRAAEAKLDPNVVSLFASFEGTVMMGKETSADSSHSGHEGHAQ
ncbi:copper uptake system-associated protein [Rhizobium sp. S163]|uniref:copper uptake system-associated protein n=1 Tax=Rhizobium sp. S163 TaxID=3055039 RepID=UPI0025A97A93|nr:copper uptake system-associated protein [Rhizobium sp. S163]MDM9645612.1 copper uptake system-associated protein [Rhizobium sp. S163]